MHALVVMPDHVHLLLTPGRDSDGLPVSISEIMHGIKGASAHSVNKTLDRRGRVWQGESFDRVLRTDEKVREKGEYICRNPVRKGLVRFEDDYRWMWREWVEGVSTGSHADHRTTVGAGIHGSFTAEAVVVHAQPGAAVLHSPIDCLTELGIPPERLPRHIAVIMDGNGRWAARRSLPRIRGHEAGADKVQEIVRRASRLGVGYLTLYSFSTENWNRPRSEVAHLMRLYVEYLIKERAEIMENGVRLVQIGRREGLPDDVLRELDETMRLSRDNPGMTLCLALNYSGRAELADAVRNIARKIVDGTLQPDDIGEETITDALYTAGIPDPDLLIRTAGEMRISNFLLWQISYAELVVTDVCWPDFNSEELDRAIRAYAQRDRRFGRVPGEGA